jgi:hypothetical protein
VPEQVDGQEVGQRLGGVQPAEAAVGQLGVHRQHGGPELRELQRVERRERQPCWVEVELFRGNP